MIDFCRKARVIYIELRFISRIYPLAVLICWCCICLSACSDANNLSRDIYQYQQRLARVLDQPPPSEPEPEVLTFPSNKTLKSSVPQLSITLTELYALRTCPVSSLIAERNTTLGLLHAPSTRYVYEIKLIQGLKDCLRLLGEDQNLVDKLNQWISMKQASLPLVWADLLQTSEEVRHAFSHNGSYLQGDGMDNANAAIQALTFLTHLAKTPNIDKQMLESQLRTLQQTPLPARIWRSQRLLAKELTNITTWLDSHTKDLDCTSPQDKAQVSYLANVFRLFFINRLQPLASTLNSYQYRLHPIYQTLLDSPVISDAFNKLLLEHQQAFNQYQTRMRQHVEFWQALFKRCGLRPGEI